MEYKRGDIILAENSRAYNNIQSGKRPYVVISNNANNYFSNIVTVVPLTTQEKNPIPTHFELYINGRKNTVLAEQITCIARDNVISVIGSLGHKNMKQIEKRVELQLGIKENKNEKNKKD